MYETIKRDAVFKVENKILSVIIDSFDDLMIYIRWYISWNSLSYSYFIFNALILIVIDCI